MPTFQDEDADAIKALKQPWETETLAQVRTGKVKPTFTTQEPSAIYKQIRRGPLAVNDLGCEGDEHAFEFHGGPEKALLQYSARHYTRWKKELPQSKALFVPGAFGENLVASNANEHNMCIGDVVRIGEVIAQVTGPRQPCYKLNHRFQVPDMSKRAQDLCRTGWFYRILKTGTIQAGDQMTLLERPNPQWTIATIQHYLYRDMRNEEMMRQIVEIRELGMEYRGIFINRLRKQYENQARRLEGAPEKALTIWKDYLLLTKVKETPRIVSLVLRAITPSEVPSPIVPGSHVRVRLNEGLIRPYSVVTGDSNQFCLAVALDEASRGGSRYIHREVQPGDMLQCGPITASFPLSTVADHHVFIAGGIGITAFIAAAQHCERLGYPCHLHYLVRSAEDIALKEYLSGLGSNVTIYDKSSGKVFNAKHTMEQIHEGTHVYCCGSERLQDSVLTVASSLGVSSSRLHFETFKAATSGDPFTADLAGSKTSIEVGEEQTLLDALREAGFDIPSSCEAGNCGTCRVGVKAGKVEHRGSGLMESDKNQAMLSCVSRGLGTVVLDL